MAISEEAAHDIAVHHRIALGRYSNTVIRRVMALSNRIEKDIMNRLGAADLSEFNRTRLEQTLAELRAIQASGWAAISDKFLADMDALAANEVAFGDDLVRAVTAVQMPTFGGAPALVQVIAAARARPFQGRVMKDWLKDVEENQARRVREVIRQGVVEGQTIDQMVKALRGTKAAQYQDGALEVSRRSAEMMVRTAVTHVSNVAQMETFQAYSKYIKAWKFTATLDSRTSLVCASLHGKEFPLGSGPLPPRHPNCRSIATPVVDIGPTDVPFTPPTFSAWLKKQPVSVQKNILGASRAKLFASGGLTVDRFVDRKGTVLSLDQLRALDASAFATAGL